MKVQIEKIVREYGYELKRKRKHAVYHHPDGRVFVMANTPSDWRAERNMLTDFARQVGKSRRELLYGPKRHKPEPILPCVPVQVELEPVETITMHNQPVDHPPVTDNITPLTKAEQKKLRRWERHYQQKAIKHAKLKLHLESKMQLITSIIKEKKFDLGLLVHACASEFRDEGRQYKVIGVGHQNNLFLTLKVGPFYLDLPNCLARTETVWEHHGHLVEMLGELEGEEYHL